MNILRLLITLCVIITKCASYIDTDLRRVVTEAEMQAILSSIQEALSNKNECDVDHLVEVNLNVIHSDTTILLWACQGRLTDVVSILIEKGANVNEKDKNGWTLLYWACSMGLTDIATVLIDKGANMNEKFNNGYTMLHWACSTGLNNVAMMLIAKGAMVNETDNIGSTPLHKACNYEDNPEVAFKLIEKGANIDVKDNYGRTPLHLAYEYGKIEVAVKLIESGAKFDVNDFTRFIPQDVACSAAQQAIVEYIKFYEASKTPIYTSQAGEQCYICLDNYKEKDILSQLMCNHYFHKICIIQWSDSIDQRSESEPTTCPVCRAKLEVMLLGCYSNTNPPI